MSTNGKKENWKVEEIDVLLEEVDNFSLADVWFYVAGSNRCCGKIMQF